MRIITWNCNMAFRKKARLVTAYQPDLLIIQECECPERLLFDADIPKPTDILWFGNNKHKGLVILSFGELKLKLLDEHNTLLQTIVPISVTGAGYDFNLFAIWAFNPTDPDGRYVEQIWKAIHHYDNLLSSKTTILAGDFNSNTIWDRKRREANHSNVVKYLADRNIHSAYHLHHQQTQGTEQHPTFYLYRHLDRPYHIDYCFVSEDLARQVQSVDVGDHASWARHSDHVPLIINFQDKPA
jgi:exonuclease III